MAASDAVKQYLFERGIALSHLPVPAVLRGNDSEEAILTAYRDVLGPYMRQNGYRSADVVVLTPDMPGKAELRAKFLREHTHSEDEVRCFVEGTGLFWFHNLNEASGDDEVFSVLCEKGDLLSVPAGIKHWFDCGERPSVTAIRIFTDRAGWVPEYTGTGIERQYSS
jgi:1,2-dihydroxy-3-keto-5-methylthiopentene dioxygenase